MSDNREDAIETMTQKAALIVGAGDATGGAIARRFAREGFVTCMVRRQADHLHNLVQQIIGADGRAVRFGCDARDEDQVVALFQAIERDIGPLEVVVFNIGANVNFDIRTPRRRCSARSGRWAVLPVFLPDVRQRG